MDNDENDVIERLRLEPSAHVVASTLLSRFPALLFTSGRRDVLSQAKAMAPHVYTNAHWIEEVYLAGHPLQVAVNTYRGSALPWNIDEITNVLRVTMLHMPDAQLNALSYHLTGYAFDCAWDDRFGDDVAAFARRIPYVNKVLTSEAGFHILHVQCTKDPIYDTV